MSNYYFTNNEKYGYVEDVEHEDDYKNIDYRDTTYHYFIIKKIV